MSEITQLDTDLQQKLIRIARETIENYIRFQKIPEFAVEESELLQKAGAFVTIRSSDRLRGCIGHVEGIKPLYETIVEMAIAASTQ